MKAMFLPKYGAPANLELREVEKPTAKANEVLVKVKSAAINDYDWSMVRGKPILYRLMFGFFTPKRPIPGMEMSGVVEAVGDKVNSLKVGDEVYGDLSDHGFGSFAEYIAIDEKAFCIKPSEISFEEAAALSHAGNLAKQGLMDLGEMKMGQKILINGAGGGVGAFALQLAKMYDAEVTGVDTGEKLNKMQAMGFDHIIDYKKQNFVDNGKKYDLILDAKSKFSPFSYPRSLTDEGMYVTVGGDLNRLVSILFFRGLATLSSKKKLKILALKVNKDLEYLNDLYQKGKINSVIDGPYNLEELPEQLQRFGDGLHFGKLIVSIE